MEGDGRGEWTEGGVYWWLWCGSGGAGGRWALYIEEIRLLPIPTPFMIQHSHIRLHGKLNK